MSIAPIKTIVAATDFSPAGNRAVALALSLCPRGATLILAHAVEPPSTPSPLYSHYYPAVGWDDDTREKVTEEAKKHLRDLLPAGAANEINIQTEVPMGHVVPALSELAEHHGASLLVVGNHGRSEFTKFLVGSVADRLTRECELPVLLVP